MSNQPWVRRAVRAWRQPLGSRIGAGELASLANDGLPMAIERCQTPGTFRAFAYRRVYGVNVNGLRRTSRRRRSRSDDHRKAAAQLQVGGLAAAIALEPLNAAPLSEESVGTTPPLDSLAAATVVWHLVRHSLPEWHGLALLRIFVCRESIREVVDFLGVRPGWAGRMPRTAINRL